MPLHDGQAAHFLAQIDPASELSLFIGTTAEPLNGRTMREEDRSCGQTAQSDDWE
jgi:hypothetical protein